jgi:hypothetical protein
VARTHVRTTEAGSADASVCVIRRSVRGITTDSRDSGATEADKNETLHEDSERCQGHRPAIEAGYG